MTDWIDRLTRLAALAERVTTLTDGVKAVARRVEDHQTRPVRLETIIEITRPNSGVLRIAPKPDAAADRRCGSWQRGCTRYISWHITGESKL